MQYIKGINFAPFPRKGVLGSPEARQSLEKLSNTTGANHIILSPAGLQDTPQSTDIDFSGDSTPSDEELVEFINYAQGQGFRVILKPTINCKNGVWRAFINFFDHEAPCEPKWGDWFASHEKFQLHYARIAADSGCVMFIMGCEMVMAERRADEWRELAVKVKKTFPGPISYNTDKYQEDAVSFWDAVDVISSSGYYPLGHWDEELDRIEKMVRCFNKPFFFAETGCMSTSGSSAIPNKWDLPGELDCSEQESWYRDMFSHCAARPWVEGFGLWAWPGKLPAKGAADKGYGLWEKSACQVVKEFYTKL
ncbi:hypothetical protein FACS1894164_16820 [Spirochaetia bacterium]|nr:hypothetical protein FACS1894164_16820 [Spirochaetia bacterium]